MAKKKAAPKPDPAPDPPRRGRPKGENILRDEANLHIRARRTWAQWVADLARFLRTDRSGVIDRALSELARREKFRDPPDRT